VVVVAGPSVGVSVSGFNADGTAGLAETPIADGMTCGGTGEYAKRALSENHRRIRRLH